MSGAATHSPAARPGTLDWEVRPARPEDAAAIAEAVAALLTEVGAASPPRRAAIEAEARAHIDDQSLGIVLVAAFPALPPGVSSQKPSDGDQKCELTAGDGGEAGVVGGELVGVLAASWARAIQVPGRMLTIEVFWTRRESRDGGVGAALLEALAGAALAEGVGRVEVGLPREGFAALGATERFYLASGFERLGPRMRRPLA